MTAADSNNPYKKVRDVVDLSDRRFDIRTLPADMQRVYKHLRKTCDEEYALATIFTIRTAVELHRAWHMTLLTNKILTQVRFWLSCVPMIPLDSNVGGCPMDPF